MKVVHKGSLPIRPTLSMRTPLQFDIDIVFTWVDLSAARYAEALSAAIGDFPHGINLDIHGEARYQSNDELRYSLRSIEKYAPWVRKIFVVTDGSRPGWLVESERLTVISHEMILPSDVLPTFNSHVIESALHRIPGLAEHFLYLNDDMLFLAPVEPGDFFTENGLMLIPLGNAVLERRPPHEAENANAWASKNAAALLEDSFGFRPERRLKHQALPQLRSVAERSEERHRDAYDRVRRNRFRSIDDVLCTGFLHPWAAFLEGLALCVPGDGWYVRIRSGSAPKRYRRILAEQRRTSRRKFGCFNDSHEPDGRELGDFRERLASTLEALFPVPSRHERDPS